MPHFQVVAAVMPIEFVEIGPYLLAGRNRNDHSFHVFEIGKQLSVPVIEKTCTMNELKNADAAFFCGTAAEVIGWLSIDDYEFPIPWKETASALIQKAYAAKVIESHITEPVALIN